MQHDKLTTEAPRPRQVTSHDTGRYNIILMLEFISKKILMLERKTGSTRSSCKKKNAKEQETDRLA